MKTKNTAFKITSDLSASLSGNHLRVRSEKLKDYNTYVLVGGEWMLDHASLSNRSTAAANVGYRPDFVAWANEMKKYVQD